VLRLEILDKDLIVYMELESVSLITDAILILAKTTTYFC